MTAPHKEKPDFEQVIDIYTAFENTTNNLVALVKMVEALLGANSETSEISYSIEKFFLREIDDLKLIYDAFYSRFGYGDCKKLVRSV